MNLTSPISKPEPATVWLTGLSGSGKSTIANIVLGELQERLVQAFIVDGDDLREGLNCDLGFSAEDRMENVRRVGEVSILFARAGFITIVPVISPYKLSRQAVRERHEKAGVTFFEVHVAAPLAACEERDPKGLYAKARSGEIPLFTGVSDPYEAPEVADLVLHTENETAQASGHKVLQMLGLVD